ncbi:MAG: hypothetical protein R3E32_23420 [Chitinophagales bacterium]
MNKAIFLKISIYILLVIALAGLGTIIYCGPFYDWRVRKSEEHVRQSIQDNYANHKEDFEELIAYAKYLPDSSSIGFSKGDTLGFILTSIKPANHSNPVTLFMSEEEDLYTPQFELDENWNALVFIEDTILKFENWTWRFQGSFDFHEITKLETYFSLTKEKLKYLKMLLEKTDCESIIIENDGDVRLVYDGFLMWYEYLIPKNESEIPEGYQKIDKNIYFGLFDSGLYCGGELIMFTK